MLVGGATVTGFRARWASVFSSIDQTRHEWRTTDWLRAALRLRLTKG